MAAAGGIRAGRAFVELYADSSKLVAGLRVAAGKLKAFGSAISGLGLKLFGLGTAASAPLLGAAKVYADVGRNLDTLSQRTGISVETLSALQYAAHRVDVALDSLVGGIARMQRQLGDAATGEKAATETLAKLGLNAEDLLQLPVEEQLKVFADRIGGLQDPAIRAALAMEVFGRGGAALLPLLNQGSAGIQQLMDRARDLGLVISSQDAKAANEFALVLKDLWATVKRGVVAVGSALAPVLKSAAEWIRKVARSVTEWINTHKEVIQKVLITIGVVIALGAALMVLGKAIVFVATVIKGVAVVLTVVKTAFAAVGAIIGGLATPIGAVIAAIVGLGGYFLWVSGAGAKALRFLGDRFALLKDHAAKAWRGIADALKAGNLELAAKIAWNGVQLVVHDALAEIREGLSWLRKQFNVVLQGIGHAFMALTEIIRNAWERTVNDLARMFTHVIVTVAPDEHAQKMRDKILKERNAAEERVLRLQAEREARIGGGPMRELDESEAAFEARMAAWQQQTQVIDDELRDAEKTLARMNMLAEQSQPGWQREYIDKQFDERERQENERHRQALANIGAENLAGMDAAEREHQKRMENLAEERKRLIAERDKLLEEAAWGRFFDEINRELDEWLPKEGPPTQRLQGVGKAVEMAATRTIGVRGTFSALEARGLGAGGVSDRILRANEQAVKELQELNDKADDGQLVFG